MFIRYLFRLYIIYYTFMKKNWKEYILFKAISPNIGIIEENFDVQREIDEINEEHNLEELEFKNDPAMELFRDDIKYTSFKYLSVFESTVIP